jgi:hypothetical protein
MERLASLNTTFIMILEKEKQLHVSAQAIFRLDPRFEEKIFYGIALLKKYFPSNRGSNLKMA